VAGVNLLRNLGAFLAEMWHAALVAMDPGEDR
jgi:hypothetical protein